MTRNGRRGPRPRPLPDRSFELPSGRTIAEAVERAIGPREADDDRLLAQDHRLLDTLGGLQTYNRRRRAA